MKVKTKYFFLWLMAVLCLISCNDEDLFVKSNNTIQVVGKVLNYTNQYVASRAGGVKTPEEMKISNMTFLVFTRHDNDEWICSDFQHTNDPNSVFQIYPQNNVTYKLYIVANVFNINETEIATKTSEWENKKTLTDLENIYYESNGIDIPSNGFPMIGHLDVSGLTSGGSQIIQIGLVALYSKIVFNIDVQSSQEVSGNLPASFQLLKWSVYDIPSKVRLKAAAENEETPYKKNTIGPFYKKESQIADGKEKVSFHFYMPEHKVHSADFTYPENLPENDYQRYKPQLVPTGDEAGNPTYVKLEGIYTDHHNNRKSVSYDVYLGNNNFDNFEIERNYQYINDITIKGLTNYKDAEVEEDDKVIETISVDHRVNFTEVPPFIVGLERETLLDSHFEVRPLRLRLDSEIFNKKSDAKVLVRILNPTTNDWIRLEQKKYADDSQDHCSNGKRKYFSTNLVRNILKNSTECVVEDNNDNCVWVYVDEYVDTIPIRNMDKSEIDEEIKSFKNRKRQATVQVAFYPDGDTQKDPTKVELYTFVQRGLYPIKSPSRIHDGYTGDYANLNGKPFIYYIEYFEEYLYDYDSENHLGLTDDAGMPWGLDGLQISSQYQAAFIDPESQSLFLRILRYLSIDTEEFINSTIGERSPFYDFYLSRDKEDKNLPNGVVVRDHAGYSFTNEILAIAKRNGKLSEGTLEDEPESAVEYCYNKNKRDNDQIIDDSHWYLPAIDEIEEIVKSAYTEFNVFQEKSYWSSQPSYIYNTFNVNVRFIFTGTATGTYYNDDEERARSTKIVYRDGDYIPESSGSQGAKGNQPYSWTIWDGSQSGTYEQNKTQPVPEDGNKSRTEKCRIRAVYKP